MWKVCFCKIYSCISLAQTVEHATINGKVMGFIPKEFINLQQKV